MAVRCPLSAAIRSVLKEKDIERTHRRGGGIEANQQKPVLVVVKSERRAPCMLQLVREAIASVLYEGKFLRNDNGKQNDSGNEDSSLENTTDGGYKYSCSLSYSCVGERDIVVSNLFRYVAVQGERAGWQSLMRLLNGAIKEDKKLIDIVAICGLCSQKENRKCSYMSRLSSWLEDECLVVSHVFAPRLDHSQKMDVMVSIRTMPTKWSIGNTKLFVGQVGNDGIERLEKFQHLTLETALKSNPQISSVDSEDEDRSSVVLPYVHEGNAMTMSGKMEEFLPISAGGKLKDRNHKPGVIYFTRDSDDEFYDSDEDPDDDLDI